MTHRNRIKFSRLLCLVSVLALAWPVLAQDKNDKDEEKRQKELQEAIQLEASPVVTAVNESQRQQGSGAAQAFIVNPRENDPTKALKPVSPAVDPAAFSWQFDMMKAADGKVYVPYTLTLPDDPVVSGPVSMYVRIVPAGAPLPEADSEPDSEAAEPFPFEDFFSVEPRVAAGQPGRTIIRAFAADPGAYDVYVGIRPKADDPRKTKDDPVRVIVVQEKNVALPDFWDGEFTTSTIVMTSRVEQVQGNVTPEMQRERPYLFGNLEFVPSLDNVFKKNDELSIVFQIYNPTLSSGKPDVTVEYSFHQKLPTGEKYFNKTTPQALNAQTLPAALDVAATQMLPGGQSVPLASFPPGDYRMEIKIVDALAKQTITRDVAFTVLGA